MIDLKFAKPPEVPPHLDQSHLRQSKTAPTKKVMNRLHQSQSNNFREILI